VCRSSTISFQVDRTKCLPLPNLSTFLSLNLIYQCSKKIPIKPTSFPMRNVLLNSRIQVPIESGSLKNEMNQFVHPSESDNYLPASVPFGQKLSL
jgi:hypothetical protein